MTPDPIYHELTKTVNISGFFVTKFESYEDRVRIHLNRRSCVGRCSRCGQFCGNIYDSKERVLRDYDWGESPVYLVVKRLRLKCPRCGIRVEKLPFADLRTPFTTRFREHLLNRVAVMTRSDVAGFYGLSEDTIGRWEWMALQTFQPTRSNLRGLKQLRVDEKDYPGFCSEKPTPLLIILLTGSIKTEYHELNTVYRENHPKASQSFEATGSVGSS